MAVIQPYKRRRAAPKARPTEKGNLRGDKGGRERGKAYPQPLPKGGEGATPEVRPAEKGDGGWTQPHMQRKETKKKKGTMGKKVNWKELMLTDIEGNEFAFDAR